MATRILSRLGLLVAAILLSVPLPAQAQKVLQVGVVRDPVNSRYATPGVGVTPTLMTRAPSDDRPSVSAC